LSKTFEWIAGDDDNCGALRSAARRVTEFYDSFLKPSGLTATQLSLLLRIQEQRKASINEIAAQMRVNRTTVTRCLKGLKESGFVQMRKSPEDRRALDLVVTGKGLRAAELAIPLWRKAQVAFDKANGAESGRMLRAQLAAIKLDD
jgi:DNA-binding MarR family transcriptional regulator